MKQKIFVVLAALALSVVAHGYLTWHFYPLHYGFASGESICNVSAKFDCDTVSASPFSSLFGIPIAAFGATYNLVLFALVLLTWLGFRGNSEKAWRENLWLSLGSVVASVVMGSISTLSLGSFCLFCLFAYGLSLIAFLGLLLAQSAKPWSHFASDIGSWFGESRAMLAWLAAIPLGAGLIHLGSVQNYGAAELDVVVRNSISEWQSSPVNQWTATPSLTKGASVEDAKMVIAEFADFRCGHCKAAAPSLSAFTKAHSEDVRLLFFSFPLDGACNAAIERGDGISCRLAKATLCSERQNLGWVTHNVLFENQSSFFLVTNVEGTDNEIKRLLKDSGLNFEQLVTCMNDPEVDTLIRAQAQEGVNAKVQGTPTIYVNGRKLERGQVLPVLEGIRNSILNSK